MSEQLHAVEAGAAMPVPGRLADRLHAELVRHGHAMHEQPDGSLVIFHWGMPRYCADIGALARFARQVGAHHG
jgi:hypothetical protein